MVGSAPVRAHYVSCWSDSICVCNCFGALSEYLSENNLDAARTAQGILLSLSALADSFTVVSYVRPVLGWWWFVIQGFIYRRACRRDLEAREETVAPTASCDLGGH